MKYENIKKAVFLERPNRFIAYVELNGQKEICHVKNTGRCRELLKPGADIFIQKSDNPERKTAYDLIAVKKGAELVNMDSQIPNAVAEEWLRSGGFFEDITQLKREKTYGNSRFDLYVETKEKKLFMEVKGVTLEEDGIARFPDAPTERGVKHIKELIACQQDGYEAYLLFVIQMKGIHQFEPNEATHPEFAETLREAVEAGVHILAYDCKVAEDSIVLDKPVPVVLDTKAETRVRKLSEPMLAWFDANARILPWRGTPTPYQVWVSEIMLQQTRVEAVKPFFERFTKALPDIEALAACPEDQLLKLWEGLGYYNRVRNMQKAAREIMEQYQGEMPTDYEKLKGLSGIGPYTAGAIASIAFQIPVPAVDGNVLRVISRITEMEEDILKQSVKNDMEKLLLNVMSKERPGAYNQALMELGAMVCVPNGPARCVDCPAADICLAHAHGREQELPVKAPKKKRRIEDLTVLIIKDGEKAAIRKRPKKGLLAGLYELPNVEGKKTADEVISWLKEQGLTTLRIQPLKEAKHIFSHVEWHMTGYEIRVDELARMQTENMLFVEPHRTEKEYPIPAAFSAYTDYLQIRLGQLKYKKEEEKS